MSVEFPGGRETDQHHVHRGLSAAPSLCRAADWTNPRSLCPPRPPPQCTVGSHVAMRVGGDFFFDPSPSEPSLNLLLVAGGVGINPLYSILAHSSDLLHLNHASGGRDYNIGSVHLCYSAKNTQELLFKVQRDGFIAACRYVRTGKMNTDLIYSPTLICARLKR